jgi:hypothetical protein
MGPLSGNELCIVLAVEDEDISPPYPFHIPARDDENRLHGNRLTSDLV